MRIVQAASQPPLPSAAIPGLRRLIQEGVVDAYQGLDLAHHLEGATEGERTRLFVHEGFGRLTLLARIELMVEEIRSTKEVAFELTLGLRGRIDLIPKSLERYYDTVSASLAAYSDQYVYSPRVREFYEAARGLGMLSEDFSLGKPLEVDASSKWRFADLFNELIAAIRDRCSSTRFKVRLRRHERNALRRVGRALQWEREMFDWRSRHLFLLLCLNYKPSVRHRIKPEEIQRHRQRLLESKRSNALLTGINGYIWKIEDGKCSGLHMHILIAYSIESKADINIARRIGEYWRDVITQGKGSYWNSNLGRAIHRDKGHGEGTGQIDRSDVVRRRALQCNIRYLAKSDQQLKRKCGEKYRTCGMSKPPRKIVAGRPRTRQ